MASATYKWTSSASLYRVGVKEKKKKKRGKCHHGDPTWKAVSICVCVCELGSGTMEWGFPFTCTADDNDDINERRLYTTL